MDKLLHIEGIIQGADADTFAELFLKFLDDNKLLFGGGFREVEDDAE